MMKLTRKRIYIIFLMFLILEIINIYYYYQIYTDKKYLIATDSTAFLSPDSKGYIRVADSICRLENPLNYFFEFRTSFLGYIIFALPFYCIKDSYFSMIIPNIIFTIGTIYFFAKILLLIEPSKKSVNHRFLISLWFISSQAILYFNIIQSEATSLFFYTTMIFYYMKSRIDRKRQYIHRFAICGFFFNISRPSNFLIYISLIIYHYLQDKKIPRILYLPLISVIFLIPALKSVVIPVFSYMAANSSNTQYQSIYKEYSGSECDTIPLCFSLSLIRGILFTFINTIPFKYTIRHLAIKYSISWYAVIFIYILSFLCLFAVILREKKIKSGTIASIFRIKKFTVSNLLLYQCIITIIYMPLIFHLVEDRYILTNNVTILALIYYLLTQSVSSS